MKDRRTVSMFNNVSKKGLEAVNYFSDIQLIRKYQDLKIKFCFINADIWFCTSCKKKRLIPNFVRSKIKENEKVVNSKIFVKFCNVVLDEEISSLYSVRDSVALYIVRIRARLVSTLHSVEWEVLDDKVREMVKGQSKIKRARLTNKLNMLAATQQLSVVRRNKQSYLDLKRTINLTDVVLTESEVQLLNKGQKYCPKKPIDRNEIVNLVASIDATVVNNEIKNECMVEVYKCLRDESFNRASSPLRENVTLKSLKNKIVKNDVIIVKADKGQSTVLLNKSEYDEKIFDFIRNNNCKELDDDPTIKFNNTIKESVSASSYYLMPKEKTPVIQMNPKAPRLYGLPKLHKEGVPLRPIVSMIGAPAEQLAKKVANSFQTITGFKGAYSLKNSYELITKLKEVRPTEQDLLLSFDIENLFGSIPPNEAAYLMQHLLLVEGSDFLSSMEVGNFIEICLAQNYFIYNGKYYLQQKGLAMGSGLSPIAAEVFLNNLEINHIVTEDNPFYSNIKFWGRYVDDIICLWTGGKDSLYQFLNYLNSRHASIKFTVEEEQEGCLNFLDLKIYKRSDGFEYGIYRKNTWTDTVIPADSKHFNGHKLSSFHALIHRALTIPLTAEELRKEFSIITEIAYNNGYERDMVRRLFRRKEKKLLLHSIFSGSSEPKHERWYTIPYVGNLSEKIGRILGRNGAKVAYKSEGSLRQMLSQPNEKLDMGSKSGVYRLACGKCQSVYVGQTGRKLRVRLKEHLARKDSTFFQHLEKCDHKDGNHKVSLLHGGKKGKKMNVLESVEILSEIKYADSCLNSKSECPHPLSLVSHLVESRKISRSVARELCVSDVLVGK